jgi:hypothetical protein
MGQHIHLVKFDVTSSDGAGNGFNYEDGTFAPDEVIERINAIRRRTAARPSTDTRNDVHCPVQGAPVLRHARRADHRAALVRRRHAQQQRQDRTLAPSSRTTTSAPRRTSRPASTPASSTSRRFDWKHNERRQTLGVAAASTAARRRGRPSSSRRTLRQLPRVPARVRRLPARLQGGRRHHGARQSVPRPGARHQSAGEGRGRPALQRQKAPSVPGGVPLPCPEAVSAADPGTMVGQLPQRAGRAARAQDPAPTRRLRATRATSRTSTVRLTTRADARLNTQPTFYPALTGGLRGRSVHAAAARLRGDKVQIRILVGAHEEGHNFSVHGIKWLYERPIRIRATAIPDDGHLRALRVRVPA